MGNGQPSLANVLSGVTGAFVGRCGRAVYARFIGPQPTLLDMPSPSARPLKYPHRGEPFDQQAHIDPCRLIIVPSGTKPAARPETPFLGASPGKASRYSTSGETATRGKCGQMCRSRHNWMGVIPQFPNSQL